MENWLTSARWAVAKDVLLTFGGLALIMYEVFAASPVNDGAIVAGLTLTGFGASFHVGEIISGFVGRSSSQPSSQHGQSHSLPSQESSGEHGK